MTCPRLIALAIAASGIALAPSVARADDRVVPIADAPDAPDEPSPPPPAKPKREPTGSFSIGAGYNSDEGFVATASVAQSNLFGTGHGLSLSAAISMLRQDFIAAYTIPNLGDGWDLRAELASHRRQRPGFVRESAGGMFELGNGIGAHTRVFGRYRAERIDITPELASEYVDPTARPLVASLGNGVLSAVGAGIQYDTRDTASLPRLGTRLELYGETARRGLGSDVTYTKLSGKLDHARPLGPLTLRVAGRASYIASNDAGGVPLSERLFHDGHADIRGYPIGSLDWQSWDRGANFEALGRVELELPVWKRGGLSVAGFFDAGMRTNEDPSWGPVGTTLHRSVGGSIIWRSPIGVLRFDLAVPLDGADRDKRFLFGIGFPF